MKRRIVSILALTLGAWSLSQARVPLAEAEATPSRGCPSEMARIGQYCIDRWELSGVDKTTGEALSPYYPPSPALTNEVWRGWLTERGELGEQAARAMPLPPLSELQRNGRFEIKAVSRPGVIPQSYLSQVLARRACENAGKRLCTQDEWLNACKGKAGRKYPYGESYRLGVCNVYRFIHPAAVLHGSASLGHRDPRLNLVYEGESPLLRKTGETSACASRWDDERAYDMVGNVDEWVEEGMFLGGFYARSTTQGCEAKVSVHTPIYYDYSTGARCCMSAE
ncbi:MAG TPA: SUMF1/EgtB/PvdO family nonheme iron enzyme [Polyangiaceae bacterium]